MTTFLIIFGVLMYIVINIIILRYIIKRSYYLTKNEISIILFSLKKQRGLIQNKKYNNILSKLNKK